MLIRFMARGNDWGKLAIVFGALVLGVVLLKAIFDKDEKVYRCPVCNLTLKKGETPCPRCKTHIKW